VAYGALLYNFRIFRPCTAGNGNPKSNNRDIYHIYFAPYLLVPPEPIGLILPQIDYKIMRLKNKIAVITGGNGGIGFGIAKEFFLEGAQGTIVGRTKETTDSSLAQLGDSFISG